MGPVFRPGPTVCGPSPPQLARPFPRHALCSVPLVTPHLARTLPATVLALLFLAEAARVRSHLRIGRGLAERATRFDRRAGTSASRVLVLGDSSGVGTGADLPEHSVAGRLGRDFPEVDVWNLAENGLRTAQLVEMLRALQGTRFHLVLIHVGVNDIVRFTPLPLLRTQLAEALALARALAEHVLLLTGGNIGLAPALPSGLRWVVTRRTREVRRLFQEVCGGTGAVYVDMFDGRVDRPFTSNPRRFFACDGFHPNSDGYALWYDAIRATMERVGVRL